jgi:mRNA interferase RelE/StbE
VASYRVEVKRKAIKELAKLHHDIGGRILVAIEALTASPRPKHVHKLVGSENSYRLRIGDYRIIYQVDDEIRLIVISRIAHRRAAYR